ncbi:Subgroup B chitinase B5 [Metarhizium anisopliae]
MSHKYDHHGHIMLPSLDARSKMKLLLAYLFAIWPLANAAAGSERVLWVANCGDTVDGLPAGMGDTFGDLNSPVVTDINSIYAGSTYTVAYVPTTSLATWSYTTSGGYTFLVSPHNPATCTPYADGGTGTLQPSVAATATWDTKVLPSAHGQSTNVPLPPTWTAPAGTSTTEAAAPTGIAVSGTTRTGTPRTGTAPTGTAPTGAVTMGQQSVAYWGQNGGGILENNDLAHYCSNGAGIDVVVLSFLFQYGSGNRIPFGNIGQSCTIVSSGEGQQCEALAAAIETCKSNGVKVIISLGGSRGAYSLSSQDEAEAIGQNLWDAYGNTKNTGRVPRPFGKTFVDGWDFDIESNSGNEYYGFLIAKLRSNFASDSENRYFITGAPQCPVPEPNMGQIISKAKFDYLWIQFYNNPSCSVDGTINFEDWKTFVAKTPSACAKLFIGVPAHPLAANGVGTGARYYLEPYKLASLVGQYRDDPAFGGVMMWSAGFSDANLNNQCTYAQEAKRVLTNGKIC